MIEIKKILFDEKNNLEKCFQIRKEVFVKEQKCDPSDEYENEEVSTHFLLLDDNGILVYSTCSLKHEQNEQVVIWLLNEFPYEAELLDTNIDYQPIDKEFLTTLLKSPYNKKLDSLQKQVISGIYVGSLININIK